MELRSQSTVAPNRATPWAPRNPPWPWATLWGALVPPSPLPRKPLAEAWSALRLAGATEDEASAEGAAAEAGELGVGDGDG